MADNYCFAIHTTQLSITVAQFKIFKLNCLPANALGATITLPRYARLDRWRHERHKNWQQHGKCVAQVEAF